MTRMNPYTRLKNACDRWAFQVIYPKTVSLDTWVNLSRSFEKIWIQAEVAQKSGCRLEVRATTGKNGKPALEVVMVKKPPPRPSEL